jgi:hypothetical protein
MNITDLEPHELRKIWSCLAERIIADHRSACNVHLAKRGAELAAESRDETYALFRKVGGPQSLEKMIEDADEARASVDRFVRDRSIRL